MVILFTDVKYRADPCPSGTTWDENVAQRSPLTVVPIALRHPQSMKTTPHPPLCGSPSPRIGGEGGAKRRVRVNTSSQLRIRALSHKPDLGLRHRSSCERHFKRHCIVRRLFRGQAHSQASSFLAPAHAAFVAEQFHA